jgi:hypothetical protein
MSIKIKTTFPYRCLYSHVLRKGLRLVRHNLDLAESFPVPLLGGHHSSVQVCLINNELYGYMDT